MTDPIDFATVPVTGSPSASGCFIHRFGAYGESAVVIFAESTDGSCELAFEWLDDHAPGHLVRFTKDDYREAAKELGVEWTESSASEGQRNRIIEYAEADHTLCGHTTLKHGTHVRAWEWHIDQVVDEALLRTVRQRFCGCCGELFRSGETWPLCASCYEDWASALTDELLRERDAMPRTARAEGAEGALEPSIDVRIHVTSWGMGYWFRPGSVPPPVTGLWGASTLGMLDSDDAVHALAHELLGQVEEAARKPTDGDSSCQ